MAQMIPREVRERLLDPCQVGSAMALASGMSGAKLFRCEADDQAWVLRCWPRGTDPARVREIHSVIGSASLACPLIPKYRTSPSPVPIREPQSFAIDSTGLIWELATWMPGDPLSYEASARPIRAGAKAIARVHQAFEKSGVWRRPSQTISTRLERTQWMNQNLRRCLVSDLTGRVHPAVQHQVSAAQKRLRMRWPDVAEKIAETLEPFRHRNFSQHYVLRDVHREHLLFEQGKVAGIIDFDAVRVDSPAVDLARWVTSFSDYGKDPCQAIENVLAGYCDDPTFPEGSAAADAGLAESASVEFGSNIVDATTAEFRTLVEAIACSSIWLSLANWVVWIVGDSLQFPDFQRVAERLGRLVESVDATANR